MRSSDLVSTSSPITAECFVSIRKSFKDVFEDKLCNSFADVSGEYFQAGAAAQKEAQGFVHHDQQEEGVNLFMANEG